MLRKRIKTLCGLDGYKRTDSLAVYVVYNNNWYSNNQSSTSFSRVAVEAEYALTSYHEELSTEYEVIDISSYKKPWLL